jgi:hypothetical protein
MVKEKTQLNCSMPNDSGNRRHRTEHNEKKIFSSTQRACVCVCVCVCETQTQNQPRSNKRKKRKKKRVISVATATSAGALSEALQ